jgi:hypothetical protein
VSAAEGPPPRPPEPWGYVALADFAAGGRTWLEGALVGGKDLPRDDLERLLREGMLRELGHEG